MATTMTTTTMTTTSTSTFRIREETFQDVVQQMNRWPVTVRELGQDYFTANKERLMTLDAGCFRELHVLLDVPEDPFAMYLGEPDARYPDGHFYALFYTLSYPILLKQETEMLKQKRDNYLRILREGNLVAWVDLFNTAIDAQAARVRAGIEDSDDHREVTIMREVWAEWKGTN